MMSRKLPGSFLVNSSVESLKTYSMMPVNRPSENPRPADFEPTHGASIPNVNNPNVGPATIPLIDIDACKTVPEIDLAIKATMVAAIPDTKTTILLEK